MGFMCNLAWDLAESVPDGRSTAISLSCTLNLVAESGRTQVSLGKLFMMKSHQVPKYKDLGRSRMKL